MSARPQVTIGPATPVRTAAPMLVLERMHPLFELWPRALTGDDADAVHDVRVASRRSREALAIFKPLFRRASYKELRGALTAVTGAFGAVRDADVHIEYFTALLAEADPEMRPAIGYLIGVLDAERSRRLDDARSAASALDLPARREALIECACDMRGSTLLDEPLSALASEVVGARARRFDELLAEALDEDAAPAQHRARIAAKRLRYAVETMRPCAEPGAYPELKAAMVAYQDALGALHDVDALIAWLEDVPARMGRVPDVFTAGVAAARGRLDDARHARYADFAAVLDRYPAPWIAQTVEATFPAPAE